MSTTQVNQSGLVLQPSQRTSYWVLGDNKMCWVTPAGLEQFFMEIGTRADDPTAPPPPITDADIQKAICPWQ
ncbi:MAG: hypothetical protein KME49_25325 [Brasilonema octagenarum HA4186-MV1]|jgi:hypothetical protein|nr:hypothetical protein [Brasilonema octagenarum HA4186-MV1]